MVRQCQAEESISDYAAFLLQQRTTLQVGLLIGRLGAARDYLLFLVKPPLQDGNEPVVPKGGKSGSGGKGAAAAGTDVQLDTEWIAEHAASVTRMLPGGIAVVGAYLLAGEKAFQAAAPQLCGLAKALRAEAGDDSLLLHIDAATGTTTLKEYPGGTAAAAASLKPVELRFTSVLSGFQTLRCSLDVDLSAPVPKGNAVLCSCFDSLVKQESARIEGAFALLDGRLIDGGAPLADAMPADADTDHPVHIELLCPPACAATGATPSRQITIGRTLIAGRLEGFAFVPRREPVTAALEALRGDLIASLRARLDSVEEEAEALAAEQDLATHPLLSKPTTIAVVAPVLPARVFMPTEAGVPVCEYQLEADSMADVVTRARELMGARLIAEGAGPAGAEEGARLRPPDAHWAPLAEQSTKEPTPPKGPNFLERLPVLVTLLLWILLGLGASLAALPVSRWILNNEYLASRP